MEWKGDYLYMVVGIIGTTIAPWMQFYQQAGVVEKGIPLKHYKYSRLDTIIGGVIVTIVCYFIVLACAATLHNSPQSEIQTAADAASALRPIAGEYCFMLFAIGLFSASIFGGTILPISTATSVCEAMGWESGVEKKFTGAPQYYAIFTLVIVVGTAAALIAAERHVIMIMLASQVINGVLLPVVVFFMLRVASDRSIMGNYANGRVFNVFAWLGTALVALMSLLMVVLTFVTG